MKPSAHAKTRVIELFIQNNPLAQTGDRTARPGCGTLRDDEIAARFGTHPSWVRYVRRMRAAGRIPPRGRR